MNKRELVDAVAKVTGLNKIDIDRAVKGVLWNVASALSKGEKVTFVGFGTFKRRHRKERIGVNPQKPAEKITIPARKAAVFVAGSELKEAIESGRAPAWVLEPLVKKASWVTKTKAPVKSKAKEKVWAKANAWDKSKAKVKAKTVKAKSKAWAKSRAVK